VALAVDDVGFAVVEDVVSDDWETRVSEFPIRMPFPLICVGIDLTEPAVGVRMSALPSPSMSATPVPWPSCHPNDEDLSLGTPGSRLPT